MNPAVPLKPRVTPLIIGLNVAVFVAMMVRGVSPATPRSEQLLDFGANFGALVVAEGQWWRPLTSMFVHVGAVHLLFNMYALWNVGSFVERLLGRPMFAVVYLLTGLAGAFSSILWNPFAISAGASGAIFGLFGVLIGFTFRARDRLPPETFQSLRSSIVTTLVFNLLFALSTQFLDHAAHLGGITVGVLAGVMATASALESNSQRPAWASQLIVLATVVALAVLADTRTKHQKLLKWALAKNRAQGAMESGDWEATARLATEAIALRDDPELHSTRGIAYLELGRDDEGIEDLRKGPEAVVAQNAVVATLSERAQTAATAKDFATAARFTTAAISVRDLPQLREARGLFYLQIGRYEEGVEDLRKAPDEPGNKNNLAWALVRLNRDLDEALKLSHDAVLAEEHAAYLGTRCWVYVARGELPSARADCEAAVKLSKHDDLMDKGMLKLIDGDREGALKIWEEAAKDPVNARDLEPWMQRAKAPAPPPEVTDGGAGLEVSD